MNVATSDSLVHQPWVGASWEGFVVDQALAALQHADRSWGAYHLLTADQREIDLLLEVDGELQALEMKLTTRPHPADLARLNANADLIGADRRLLVCRRSDLMVTGTQVVCDVEGLVDYIERP